MVSSILLALLACGETDPDDPNRPGKDGNGTDDSGEDNQPDPESDCFDGVDNDEDGKIDCEDSDCVAAEPECSWPDGIDHRSVFDFTGRTVTCETWIGDFDEDVPNCQTAFNSGLTHVTDGPLCGDCDRTYYGSFDYTTNTCGEIFGGDPLPTEGRFGFVFVDDNVWELWGMDESTGAWSKAVDLKKGGDGRYTFVAPKDAVEYDSGECDNDPLYVGDLVVEISFTPR
jgi:hypothetical protein